MKPLKYIRDNVGNTPLMYAMKRTDYDSTKALLKYISYLDEEKKEIEAENKKEDDY